MFSRRTHRTQDARVCSHDRPIGRRTRGYVLTTDPSDAGRAGILSRRTNRTQPARFACVWCAKASGCPSCREGTPTRPHGPGEFLLGVVSPPSVSSPSSYATRFTNPYARIVRVDPHGRTGTNRTQDARVYSHDEPIGRRTR
eukprot:9467562-Pyramimonas_sp.AAC.1